MQLEKDLIAAKRLLGERGDKVREWQWCLENMHHAPSVLCYRLMKL